MRKINVLFLAVLLAGTAFCTAQQQKAQQPRVQQQNKWEVFGGYSLNRMYGYPNIFSAVTSTSNYDQYAGFNTNGGQASVTYFPVQHIGITADFTALTKNQAIAGSIVPASLHATQTVHEQDYLFGPTYRYKLKNRPVSLFAHQLFGVAHTTIAFTPSTAVCYSSNQTNRPTCSANPFTMVSGGGVDVRVNSHISIRPAQLDYWTQQISMKKFMGSGFTSDDDSGKFGVDGFRYSVGAVINF